MAKAFDGAGGPVQVALERPAWFVAACSQRGWRAASDERPAA
jgi:hypothetical protein